MFSARAMVVVGLAALLLICVCILSYIFSVPGFVVLFVLFLFSYFAGAAQRDPLHISISTLVRYLMISLFFFSPTCSLGYCYIGNEL